MGSISAFLGLPYSPIRKLIIVLQYGESVVSPDELIATLRLMRIPGQLRVLIQNRIRYIVQTEGLQQGCTHSC
jgi:hypothetical protein